MRSGEGELGRHVAAARCSCHRRWQGSGRHTRDGAPALRPPCARSAVRQVGPRVIPLTIQAGVQTSQNIEMHSPIRGSKAKPAMIAPTVAPTVFAAYNRPASTAAWLADGTIQREASGNVAPMPAAGTASSTKLNKPRKTLNMTLGCPSAYAFASSGPAAASSRGSKRARAAMAVSIIAKIRSAREGLIRRPKWPPAADPIAKPPMNAARTVLVDAAPRPISRVSKRIQVTS